MKRSIILSIIFGLAILGSNTQMHANNKLKLALGTVAIILLIIAIKKASNSDNSSRCNGDSCSL